MNDQPIDRPFGRPLRGPKRGALRTPARERLAHAFFSKWNKRDFEELVRLVVRFADQIGSG